MKRKMQRTIRRRMLQQSLVFAVTLATASAFNAQALEHEGKGKDSTHATSNEHHGDKTTHFIKEAAMGNKMEVKMGQLGEQQGQNQQIKDLAKMLVTDHQQAQQKLQQIAQQKGVQLDDMDKDSKFAASGSAGHAQVGVDADKSDTSSKFEKSSKDHEKHAKHQQLLDELKSKSGAEFDKAFAKEAIKDHKKDVAKFEKASKEITDSSVKGYIDETLPKLRQHLQAAQNAAKTVGLTESDLTMLDQEMNQEAPEAAGAPAGTQGSSSNSLNQDNKDLNKDLDKSNSDSTSKSLNQGDNSAPKSQTDNNSSSSAKSSSNDQLSLDSSATSSSTRDLNSSQNIEQHLSQVDQSGQTAAGGPAQAESSSGSSSSSSSISQDQSTSSAAEQNSSTPDLSASGAPGQSTSGTFHSSDQINSPSSSSRSGSPSVDSNRELNSNDSSPGARDTSRDQIQPEAGAPAPGYSSSGSSDTSVRHDSNLDSSIRTDSSASSSVDVNAPSASADANVDLNNNGRSDITMKKDDGKVLGVETKKDDGKVLGVKTKKGDGKVLGMSTDKHDGRILGLVPMFWKKHHNVDTGVSVGSPASNQSGSSSTSSSSSDSSGRTDRDYNDQSSGSENLPRD